MNTKNVNIMDVEYFEKMLKSKSMINRLFTARKLGNLDLNDQNEKDWAVEILSDLLNDKNAEVKLEVRRALNKLGTDIAVPDTNPMNSRSKRIREKAIKDLMDDFFSISYYKRKKRQFDYNWALEPLIKLLKDKDAGIRYSASRALGHLRYDSTVDPLILAFETENDDSVKSAIIESLSKIGNPEVLDLILEATKHDGTRLRAIIELGNSAWQESGVDTLPLTMKLIELLEIVDEESRYWVVHSLAALHDEEATEYLVEVLSDENKDHRFMAIRGLERIGNEVGIDAIIKCLNDSESVVRINAIHSLGKLRSYHSVNPLLIVLDCSEEWEACKAAISLGKIGDPSASKALIEFLDKFNSIDIEDIPDYNEENSESLIQSRMVLRQEIEEAVEKCSN